MLLPFLVRIHAVLPLGTETMDAMAALPCVLDLKSHILSGKTMYVRVEVRWSHCLLSQEVQTRSAEVCDAKLKRPQASELTAGAKNPTDAWLAGYGHSMPVFTLARQPNVSMSSQVRDLAFVSCCSLLLVFTHEPKTALTRGT